MPLYLPYPSATSANWCIGDLYLGDTLLVLSAEENGPCNATRVLALKEEGFGLSILESEDLAITTDV